MENFKTSADVLFILLGAIMILAMHAGFAFLELGTVRKKNQVNALVKILVDFSVSPMACISSPAPRNWRKRAATTSPSSSSC
jgi:ammonium transporter, Amt family